jgi:hypothetical protein
VRRRLEPVSQPSEERNGLAEIVIADVHAGKVDLGHPAAGWEDERSRTRRLDCEGSNRLLSPVALSRAALLSPAGSDPRQLRRSERAAVEDDQPRGADAVGRRDEEHEGSCRRARSTTWCRRGFARTAPAASLGRARRRGRERRPRGERRSRLTQWSFSTKGAGPTSIVPRARIRSTSTSSTVPPSASPTATDPPSGERSATPTANGIETERPSTGSSVLPLTRLNLLPAGSLAAASSGSAGGGEDGPAGVGPAASSPPPQPASTSTTAASRRSLAIISSTPPGRSGFQ